MARDTCEECGSGSECNGRQLRNSLETHHGFRSEEPSFYLPEAALKEPVETNSARNAVAENCKGAQGRRDHTHAAINNGKSSNYTAASNPR